MVDTGTDARKKGWAGRQCTVSLEDTVTGPQP